MYFKNLISVLLAVALSTMSFAQDKGIQFDHNSTWNELLAKAKAQNKLIFVDAFTTWCGPCKWMAKNVFTNDTVADYYNRSFVCAKIDMEKGEGIELAKKYGVRNYPTLMYINADGELTHRTCGVNYNGPACRKFIQDGKDALDPDKQLAAFIKKFDSGKMEASAVPSYLYMLKNGCMNADAASAKYLGTQAEKDLSSRSNWTIIRDFVNDDGSREFNFLVNNSEVFAKLYTKDSVETKINDVYKNSLISKIRGNDDKGYETLKVKVNSLKNINGEKTTSHSDMSLYKYKKNWAAYSPVAFAYIDKYANNDANLINSIAWTIYENVDEKAVLEKASALSKHSTELNDSYAFNDTFACLLYKSGKKEEAVKAAEHAIDLAKKSNEDYKSTQELLDKIKMLK